MAGRIRGWFKRHPRITYTIYLFVTVVVLSEIALRIFVGYDPSYYMAYKDPKPGAVLEYPYGTISFNSDCYPDEEFEKVKSRPRVAYVGDSVCYGVGAGYGHRISEVLEGPYPQYEHMNLTYGLGGAINSVKVKNISELADRYDLDVVIYLMNLNDIMPDNPEGGEEPAGIFRLGALFDWLRGRSYLYTFLRTAVKNIVARAGHSATGHRIYEHYPQEFEDVFRETCKRVNLLDRELAARGAQLIVLILPYEMQISADAERTYAELGIAWEGDAFIERGPQKMLMKYLDGPEVLDGCFAFIDESRATDRSTYKVGETFVYNKGDKIDWNHPNRTGHRLLAEFVGRSGLLEDLPMSN